MAHRETGEPSKQRDFFISYAEADTAWAEWIGLQLEQASLTVALQAWDLRPGMLRVPALDHLQQAATRTLLLLSPASLSAGLVQAQWAAALQRDPTGEQRTLIPIRVETCEPEGLLGSLVPIDLVNRNEEQARACLLEGVQDGRGRPAAAPFPGQGRQRAHVAFPGAFPALWNLPSARNPSFTGREEELRTLRERLHQQHQAAISQPQSISGLGGVGKTQLAIEYAYRHRGDYTAVLWVRADTTDTLTASYNELAAMLALPERAAREQDIIVRAVQTWLRTTPDYLLIFDNADTPEVLLPFLPTAVAGHVLLTTRAADLSDLGLGLDDPLALPPLTPEEGAHLLLQRAGMLAQATPEDHARALALSRELGGLPLALDQAGAYIRKSRLSLSAYHQRYQQHHARLLNERYSREHPAPVATTWDISFRAVAASHPAAADLLRFCAFLPPDAIPEELLTAGAAHLGPLLAPIAADPLELDAAIMALRAYSLIERDPQEQTLTVHRLVQAVMRESLPDDLQRTWRHRVLLALYEAFPDPEYANWPHCERLLSHAQTCAHWIEHTELLTNEAGYVLNQAGSYLVARGRYGEAEPLYKRALAIREQVLGAQHPDTAGSLNNLALLYHEQGRYEEAEPLYKRALAIHEQVLGALHPATATSLNNQAGLYDAQGRYEEAEPLYKRALAIRGQVLGAEHPDTATSLNNLAGLYKNQGRYEEAEPLYERALAICEQVLGAEHPDTASSLNNLAALYDAQGRYEEAEPLYERALAIYEQVLGTEHPDTASSLNNLAILYCYQERYEKAEPLLRRALAICERALGDTHPLTLSTQGNYYALLEARKRNADAS